MRASTPMMPGENPPVGVILAASRGEAEAHYALEGLPNTVLASGYRTVLPDEKLLAEEIERVRRSLERRDRTRVLDQFDDEDADS